MHFIDTVSNRVSKEVPQLNTESVVIENLTAVFIIVTTLYFYFFFIYIILYYPKYTTSLHPLI